MTNDRDAIYNAILANPLAVQSRIGTLEEHVHIRNYTSQA
jgi:hypothetical protein